MKSNLKFLDLNNLSKNDTILFNKLSIKILNDYNDLIKKIFLSSDKSINWIVNILLSRNNYLSELFNDLCYIELVKTLSKKEDYDILIVPSKKLKFILNQFFLDKNIKIKIKSTENSFINLNNKFFVIKNFFYNLLLSINLYFSSFLSYRNKRINNDIILIDTWVTDYEISSNSYSNRFYDYNYLSDNINSNLKEKIFFLPEFSFSLKNLLKLNFKSVYKSIDNSEFNHLFKSDFLYLSDYLFALFSPLKIKKINFKDFYFNKLNISELLNYEFERSLFHHNSFLGLLNYRFFYNLSKTNIHPKKIISWFENQPSDKGFSFSVNKFFPNVEFIGYQNFLVSYDYCHYMIPTEYEYQYKLIPKKIAVIGNKQILELKKFYNNILVINVPGLRFSHIYNYQNKKRNDKDKIILMALPLDLNLSKSIIETCNKIFKNNKIFKILIKPHPNINNRDLKLLTNDLLDNFKIVKSSLNKYLKVSKLFISAGATPCFESISMGIPTIIICPKGSLNQNPIPKYLNNIIWSICYNDNDLEKSINKFSSYGEVEYDKIDKLSRYIRKNYFYPLNKKNINKFIN